MTAAGAVPPVVELRIWGVRRVGPALLRMASGRRALHAVPGLRFAKLLGTGSGHTFTPRDADPHHWALLTVWDGPDVADAHAVSPLVRSWTAAAHEELVVRMVPTSSRGFWSGREPFVPTGSSGPDGEAVAAITRARLRPQRTLSFWRAVPPVVEALAAAPGNRLALGVGEAPVGLQGTFSLWRSPRDLTDFAYRGAAHRDAIRRTRPERWYAEELFARLRVLSIRGTHEGRTP